MMDGLAVWLKQTIAVVLLAALVDLMLPNRAMQRYVRLVAGLLILLTVATPLLQFLKGDFSGRLAEDWDKMTAQAKPAFSSPLDLQKIEAEGERWRKQREEDAVRFASAQIEEAIRHDVEQMEGRKAEQVTVSIGQSPTTGIAAVQSVTVLLASQTDEQETLAPRPIARIEPVAPVTIDLRANRQEEIYENEMPDSRVRIPETQLKQRIEALIAAKYNVPVSGITVLETVSQENGGG